MNYMQINDIRIELTEEQATEFKKRINEDKVQLSAIEPGKTFKAAEHELVVLEQTDSGTAVILKDLWRDDEVFSKTNNNFDGSNMDELCQEFEEELKKELGQDIFVKHSVDLTSDDGLKDYGVIKRNVSLLTSSLYRKYVEILDKHKLDAWWWLSTPHSTKTHGDEKLAACISPSGYIGYSYCNYCQNGGVRPFCILKSNTLYLRKDSKNE